MTENLIDALDLDPDDPDLKQRFEDWLEGGRKKLADASKPASADVDAARREVTEANNRLLEARKAQSEAITHDQANAAHKRVLHWEARVALAEANEANAVSSKPYAGLSDEALNEALLHSAAKAETMLRELPTIPLSRSAARALAAHEAEQQVAKVEALNNERNRRIEQAQLANAAALIKPPTEAPAEKPVDAKQIEAWVAEGKSQEWIEEQAKKRGLDMRLAPGGSNYVPGSTAY